MVGPVSGRDEGPKVHAAGVRPAAEVITPDEDGGAAALWDYFSMIHRHRWAAALVFVLVAGWGVYSTLSETPVYSSTPALLEIVSDSGGVTTVRDVFERQAVTAQHFETQMNLIGSEGVLQAAYDSDPEFAAHMSFDECRSGLDVSGVRNSFLVRVRFRSPHAAINAKFANAVARTFIESSRAQREERNSRASVELDRRREEAARAFEEADLALEEFRNRAGVPDVRAEKTKLDEQLSRLEEQRDAAALEVIQRGRLRDEFEKAREAGQPSQIAEVQEDPIFQVLDRALIEAEEAEARARSTLVNADAAGAETRRARDRRDERVEAIYGKAVRAHETARDAMEKITALCDQRRKSQERLGALLVEQSRLEATRERRHMEVEAVAARAGEVQGAQGFDLSPAVLWEEARASMSPISPRPVRDIAGTTVLALLLALGAVVVLEQFNDSIVRPEEARRVTGLPVLGMLPKIEVSEVAPDLATLRDPTCGMAEAIRIIRTGILFSPGGGRAVRRILVTSAEMGEGKTLTSTNLAVAMAQAGQKTLLVDCDLRNPRLHKVFSFENRSGLTNIFSNGSLTAPSHRIEGANYGLDLVTSGPMPPNPAELVGGERMAEYFRNASTDYDCVVIDSPPAGPVSDPALLSRQVDGVILVLELGKTSMRALRRAHDHLSKVGAPMLGIVLNGVRLNPRGYYYYYSRYGYVAGGGRSATTPTMGNGKA